MKTKKRLLRLELAAALVLIATSCVPEFKNPLPPPADGKADEAILGVWETPPDEDEARQVSIFPNKSGGIDVVWIADMNSGEGLTVSVFTGHTTRIGEDKFLSLIRRNPDNQEPADEPEKRAYFIAPYETSAERLIIKGFSLSAFRRMIEQSELDGEVHDGEYFDKIVVTSSSEDLAGAIGQKGVPALVEEDTELKYRKLHQRDRKKSLADQRQRKRGEKGSGCDRKHF